MKFSHLVGKVAADQSSQKLGKIIDIVKLPRDWHVKKDSRDDRLVEHFVIFKHQILKKDATAPVDAGKVIKEDGNFVWLDISKEEFDESIKKAGKIMKDLKRDPREDEKWKVRWGDFMWEKHRR
ncbi:MAG: hypothetical protein GF308_21690 [Candidatus Heimdallarchaeota archaeon]|nr:hypothetical protein [Candidatus Heimdallarchaeota archaeon]